MSCPCGLTKSEILQAGDLVVKGICQAPRRDNREILCGELLADHPAQQAGSPPPLPPISSQCIRLFVYLHSLMILSEVTVVK